jgi:hypothetical protein
MKHILLAITALCLASCTCAGKKDCATCSHCDKAAAAKVEICKMCGKAKPNCCCKKH